MIPAPPWAFAAEAIDGTGDTHLAKGVHVRALPSPAAGIPATPLLVYRAALNGDQVGRLAQHTEVVWIDSFGNVLTTPFNVEPSNPVTGHLIGGQAIWAQLTARAVPPDRITFAALAGGPSGLHAFMQRDDNPFIVAGQRIDAVRVSGRGAVIGLRWIARDEAVKGLEPKLRMIWSLPVEPAPRYRPTPDARSEAKQRVERGTPQRIPQYGLLGHLPPGSAPPAPPGFSLDRVALIEADFGRWLDRLLNDLSLPPQELLDVQPADDGGEVALAMEPHLLAASVDPDCGHWLGFGDVDPPEEPVGTLLLYFVRGLWRDVPANWEEWQRVRLAPHWRVDRDAAMLGFDDLRALDLEPLEKGPFLDLTALAVAVVGFAPLPPASPIITGFEDRGWLPEPPPPDVRRHTRIHLAALAPRALLAAAADDGVLRSLNPVIGEGRPKPGEVPRPETMLGIIATQPPDAAQPDQGRIDDRDAVEAGAKYTIAQGDWFGRWGEWSSGTSAAKARTPPLPPSVELAYQPPLAAAAPVPDGPLAGVVTIRVAIPRIDDLPPGGHRLDRLELSRSIGGGAPVVTTLALSAAGPFTETHPAPLHDVIVVTETGPALQRAASTTISVTGRWIDVGGLASAESAPAQREIIDPRPPPLPVMPTELQYSARPDAAGFARVELRWAAIPGARYRVFASSERTLLGALRARGQGAVADAIAATPAGAPRAMAIRAQKARFSWDAFESVTASPLVATGPTASFVHRVSGSLDVLAAYRVLTEGPSGVLSEITEAEIVPVAVPNLGPPPVPLASLGPIDYEQDVLADGATLEVLVPPGRAFPAAWRLRRATVASADALRMDVVATGAIPAGAGTPSGTRFDVPLAGPLKPWRQYRFVVEVQAGPPPGAPTAGEVPVGEWSAPSAPVTLSTIPPAAPAPLSALEATILGSGDVRLRATHPEPGSLVGTPFGAYRFEVHRLSPGARPKRLGLQLRRAADDRFEAIDPAPPEGSAWSVRVLDPLGRPSGSLTVRGSV